MLLDAGADINCEVAKWGATAMSHAVYNGNLGLVKMLIGKGADPMQTFESKPLVSHALEQGHTESQIFEYHESNQRERDVFT